jgi:hypothetical protein
MRQEAENRGSLRKAPLHKKTVKKPAGERKRNRRMSLQDRKRNKVSIVNLIGEGSGDVRDI